MWSLLILWIIQGSSDNHAQLLMTSFTESPSTPPFHWFLPTTIAFPSLANKPRPTALVRAHKTQLQNHEKENWWTFFSLSHHLQCYFFKTNLKLREGENKRNISEGQNTATTTASSDWFSSEFYFWDSIRFFLWAVITTTKENPKVEWKLPFNF